MSEKSRSRHRRCSVIKKVFLNVLKFYSKTSVLQSLFNNVVSLQPCSFIKETPTHVFFCEICEIFNSTYFEEHLQTTASEFLKNSFTDSLQ